MHALVAGPAVPGGASMYVMSTPETSRELDRGRLLRDELARSTVTSAEVRPLAALAIVRAVFDAVSLLLRPPPAAAAATDGSGARPGDRLARLWKEHRGAPCPDSFRGVDIAGVELILLDAAAAGLVHSELNGGLDAKGVAGLWACIADLDRIESRIDSECCASYFTRLRTMARLVAARHTPAAI